MTVKKLGWEKCPDGNAQLYMDKCKLFVADEKSFANFKRDKDYGKILEGGEKIVGEIALKGILKMKGQTILLDNLKKFKENEMYGNPILHEYELTGPMVPSTLRYVNTYLEVKELTKDHKLKKIVEVGGGYGGLCKTISVLENFDEYTMVDLPPAIALCQKYLNHFDSIKNKIKYISCEDIKSLEAITDVDLFISDSALAECDLETQILYTKTIAKKSKFIYVNFNTLHIKSAAKEMKLFIKSFPNKKVQTYQSGMVTAIIIDTTKEASPKFFSIKGLIKKFT
ncbi:MAG: putative sugar O-methyltransferase [Patescibacteria group bacterium]|jgi:hypothetical protein